MVLTSVLTVGAQTGVALLTENAADLPSVQARSRYTHAQELFPNPETGVKLEGQRDLRPFILKSVRRNLPEKFKHQAYEIARAIITEANYHKMDPLFLLAVIKTESRFRPNARGRHGEIGLMQVLPSTAQWLAAQAGVSPGFDLHDPAINIRIGATYFAQLRKSFKGRGSLYVSAYNMGSANVRRLMASNIQPKTYSGKVLKNYSEFYSLLEKQSNQLELTAGKTAKIKSPGVYSRAFFIANK